LLAATAFFLAASSLSAGAGIALCQFQALGFSSASDSEMIIFRLGYRAYFADFERHEAPLHLLIESAR
jgi:hypothetical protein